jgi:hypothetical protein
VSIFAISSLMDSPSIEGVSKMLKVYPQALWAIQLPLRRHWGNMAVEKDSNILLNSKIFSNALCASQ